MYTALLDAACLVPVVLTDTLLRLAERGLYQPLWSPRILDEVRRTLADIHPDLAPTAITRRLQMMDAAFGDASVDPAAWQPLVAGLDLPDPDDRHVLAAAIAGGAHTIVTPNLKDFPTKHLAPHGIQAVSPDAFLLDHLDLSPPRVLAALAQQAADTARPPLTVFDLLGKLSRAGVPSFASEALRHLARRLTSRSPRLPRRPWMPVPPRSRRVPTPRRTRARARRPAAEVKTVGVPIGTREPRWPRYRLFCRRVQMFLRASRRDSGDRASPRAAT